MLLKSQYINMEQFVKRDIRKYSRKRKQSMLVLLFGVKLPLKHVLSLIYLRGEFINVIYQANIIFISEDQTMSTLKQLSDLSQDDSLTCHDKHSEELEIRCKNQTTLSFDNLLGDDEPDTHRKEQHNRNMSSELAEVISMMAKNGRSENCHMRICRPLQIQESKPAINNIKVQEEVLEPPVLPKKHRRMGKILHKLYEDTPIKTLNDETDTINLWVGSKQSVERSLTTPDESFLSNLIHESENNKSILKELTTYESPMLKPPHLPKFQSSSYSARSSRISGFNIIKEELAEAAANQISTTSGEISSPVLQRFAPNPVERSMRVMPAMPKKLVDFGSRESSPINQLLNQNRTHISDFSAQKKESPLKKLLNLNNCESKVTNGPQSTSKFYLEYLRSIRKATHLATPRALTDRPMAREFPFEQSSYFLSSNAGAVASK